VKSMSPGDACLLREIIPLEEPEQAVSEREKGEVGFIRRKNKPKGRD